MTENQSVSSLSSHLINALQPLIKEIAPSMIVVQGDTTTAFIAGLCAYYERVPVAHVEAGLRTGDKFSPYPEEMNRKLLSHLADLHFAPTETAAENLRKENIQNIHVVGNTVIDSLLRCEEIARNNTLQNRIEQKFGIDLESTIIGITAHRRESFGKGLESICTAIQTLSKEYPEYQFVFPVHLNPKVQSTIKEKLSSLKNVKLTEPMQYDEWVTLMSACKVILTDSGGIQEEAPSLNVPVLVMRNKTERPEALETGATLLVGTQADTIVGQFRRLMQEDALLERMVAAKNPYGDGKSAERIVEHIISWLEAR